MDPAKGLTWIGNSHPFPHRQQAVTPGAGSDGQGHAMATPCQTWALPSTGGNRPRVLGGARSLPAGVWVGWAAGFGGGGLPSDVASFLFERLT